MKEEVSKTKEGKSDGVLKKFKSIKNIEIVVAVILIAIVLIIFITNFKKTEVGAENDNFVKWCDSQENRAEKILGKIKGAGKVEVMITYESSFEKVYAYKTSSKTVDGKEVVTQELLYVSGKPILIKETPPRIQGVVIVAEGASNPTIKLEIIRAIIALCNVQPSQIEVFTAK